MKKRLTELVRKYFRKHENDTSELLSYLTTFSSKNVISDIKEETAEGIKKPEHKRPQ